jgi:hypothetical protein
MRPICCYANKESRPILFKEAKTAPPRQFDDGIEFSVVCWAGVCRFNHKSRIENVINHSRILKIFRKRIAAMPTFQAADDPYAR